MFSWFKSALQKLRMGHDAPVGGSRREPCIVPRSEHCISRANISDKALKVLYRLRQGGYEAYLVGGGVRDLLLGREPKDFDVATDATPEEVKRLFRNCRLIGRRFRLAHVHFGREIIEVATFRASHDEMAEGEGVVEDGRILRDNVYGTLEDDAWRRDFTLNALYYDINDFAVVDYTGGLEDLEAGRLRIIGDPAVRYREDAVRMLRAVRFAAKLGFRVDEASEKAIFEHGHLLEEIPPARLFDEVLKLFQGGYAAETFELLRHYRLFGYLFPETDVLLQHEEGGFPLTFVARALENTDERVARNKPITPAFLFAAFLWEPVRSEAALLREEGANDIEAMQVAGDAVVSRQVQRVSFPKRFSVQSREIWTLQERLKRRGGRRAERLVTHPRFRAAYDFLLLRAQCGEPVQELADWWTHYQETDEAGRQKLTAGMGKSGKGRRRRPRRRGKPKGTSQSNG